MEPLSNHCFIEIFYSNTDLSVQEFCIGDRWLFKKNRFVEKAGYKSFVSIYLNKWKDGFKKRMKKCAHQLNIVFSTTHVKFIEGKTHKK